MVTPKPVDLSGVTTSISAQFESSNETSICTVAGTTMPVEVDMSLSNLPGKIQGESVEFQVTRSPGTAKNTTTANQNSSKINTVIPAPPSGATINYTYSGEIIVSRSIYRPSYAPPSGSSGARVSNTRLTSSQYRSSD